MLLLSSIDKYDRNFIVNMLLLSSIDKYDQNFTYKSLDGILELMMWLKVFEMEMVTR